VIEAQKNIYLFHLPPKSSVAKGMPTWWCQCETKTQIMLFIRIRKVQNMSFIRIRNMKNPSFIRIRIKKMVYLQ